jgi:predicted extracellular nuclease
MRIEKLFTLLLLAIQLLVAQPILAQKKAKVVCVAFYNFENYFDTLDNPLINDDDFTPLGAMQNTPEVFQKKTENLARVVRDIGLDVSLNGPAILGVAEIENVDVLLHFAQHPFVKARNYTPIHYDSKDGRGIDVALLYNPSLFVPLHSAPLFVEIKNEEGKLSYTRDVLWVTGLLDGDTTHIFVNHWPSRRGGEKKSSPRREAAAAVAKHVIDSLTTLDQNTRIILMGDLNDDPTNKSVRKVLNASFDSEQTEPGQLFNPFYDFFKRGDGTLAYRDAWNLFDQIMVSEIYLHRQKLGIAAGGYSFYKAGIFKPDYLIEQEGRFQGYPKRSFTNNGFNDGFSDHFPSYLFLIKPLHE